MRAKGCEGGEAVLVAQCVKGVKSRLKATAALPAPVAPVGGFGVLLPAPNAVVEPLGVAGFRGHRIVAPPSMCGDLENKEQSARCTRSADRIVTQPPE